MHNQQHVTLLRYHSNISFPNDDLSGDFMDEHKLPAADLYLLSQIIHDWRPDQVDFILDKVFKGVLPGTYNTYWLI